LPTLFTGKPFAALDSVSLPACLAVPRLQQTDRPAASAHRSFKLASVPVSEPTLTTSQNKMLCSILYHAVVTNVINLLFGTVTLASVRFEFAERLKQGAEKHL